VIPCPARGVSCSGRTPAPGAARSVGGSGRSRGPWPGSRCWAWASRNGSNGPLLCAASGWPVTHTWSPPSSSSTTRRRISRCGQSSSTGTPLGPGLSRSPRELVGLVPGQGPEPLGQRQVGRGQEVDGQVSRAQPHPIGCSSPWTPHAVAVRVDAGLGVEPHQAPGPFVTLGRGDHDQRTVQGRHDRDERVRAHRYPSLVAQEQRVVALQHVPQGEAGQRGAGGRHGHRQRVPAHQRGDGQAELVHQAGRNQFAEPGGAAFAEDHAVTPLGQPPQGQARIDPVPAGHDHVGCLAGLLQPPRVGGGAGDHQGPGLRRRVRERPGRPVQLEGPGHHGERRRGRPPGRHPCRGPSGRQPHHPVVLGADRFRPDQHHVGQRPHQPEQHRVRRGGQVTDPPADRRRAVQAADHVRHHPAAAAVRRRPPDLRVRFQRILDARAGLQHPYPAHGWLPFFRNEARSRAAVPGRSEPLRPRPRRWPRRRCRAEAAPGRARSGRPTSPPPAAAGQWPARSPRSRR